MYLNSFSPIFLSYLSRYSPVKARLELNLVKLNFP